MRRLSFVLVLALAGCADSSKKGDDASPPPNNSGAKAQPAAQPKPAEQPKPAQPAPAEPPSSDEPIVIKGSKHKDSGPSSSSSKSSANQAKIDELNAKARESQGKDNGQPLKAEDPAAKGDHGQGDLRKKEELKAQIADKDAQIAKLQEERKGLIEEGSHREGRFRVKDIHEKDPERIKAIDAEVEQLKKDKFELQKKLAVMEHPPKEK